MLSRLASSVSALGLIWWRSLIRGTGAAKDLDVLFDSGYYLARYPDVARSLWPARVHYLLFGVQEGRDAHPMFDSAYYTRMNPDVRGSRFPALFHYVLYGAAEGRSPHPDFDARNYLGTHPELAGRGVNPLVHFLLHRDLRAPASAPAPSAEGRRTEGQSAPAACGASAEPVSAEAKLRMLDASRDLMEALAGKSALVSVIIPCFNYGKYLWDALASVLSQTYPHIEIVIIDDGSTDAETLQVLDRIRHERVRVVHQSNQGLAQTRNNGAAVTQGEYLLYLDADDRLERNAVALLLYALLRNPEAAYAYPQQRFFGDENLVWAPQAFNAYDLLWSNHPSVCSLIRRKAFEGAGGYRPELLYGYEDWEFWIRLASKRHYGVAVAAPVFEHRRHGVTMTHTAHERQRFLYTQILNINASSYTPEAVTATKQAWRPLISVVVPFYNRPGYLKETLASLEAQTIRDFEIVLVNDGSDDPESLRYLDRLRGSERIRVVDAEHGGPAAARNLGAQTARAEFVMFLDSDDLLAPSALEKLCWTLANNPSVAFVYSGVVHFGDIEATCYDEFDAARLQKENYLTVTCVIRREIFLELGGNDPALTDTHEDYDFWLRLVERGYRGKLFREPLFRYRRHAAGVSTERIEAACAGAGGLSTSVVERHNTVRERPPSLKCPQAVPADEILERVSTALRGVLPAGVPEQRYRRPNAPNPFCTSRWNAAKRTILYLIPSFYVGGAEIFDLRILSCLRERYHVVLVACEQPDGPWCEDFQSHADETFSLERMGTDWSSRLNFLRYLMISKCVDLVFNRNTFYGYELAEKWRGVSGEVRYVDILHLHAYGEDWVRASAPYHEKMDLRYVISEDLREYAVAQYNLTRDPFHVLYFGLNPEDMPDEETRLARRRSIREQWNISEAAFVVGFIGRFTEQKDPLRWMSVAAHIAAQRPDAVFLLVGDGELLQEARSKAAKLGLSGRTIFAGYQHDASHYCAAMDAMLLTSRYEGLPVVILESLAHGTPVVATDVGGTRECLDADIGQLLPVDAGDAEFAQAVLKFAQRPAGMGERCRAILTSRFTKERMRGILQEDLACLAGGLNREQRRRDYQMELMARAVVG